MKPRSWCETCIQVQGFALSSCLLVFCRLTDSSSYLLLFCRLTFSPACSADSPSCLLLFCRLTFSPASVFGAFATWLKSFITLMCISKRKLLTTKLIVNRPNKGSKKKLEKQLSVRWIRPQWYLKGFCVIRENFMTKLKIWFMTYPQFWIHSFICYYMDTIFGEICVSLPVWVA